jgi:hypothetical protein
MSSEAASAAQNPTSLGVASRGPGIASIIVLSTISMIVIETVSEASAIGAAAASAIPARTSGRLVSE